jgi:hypothetical protein
VGAAIRFKNIQSLLATAEELEAQARRYRNAAGQVIKQVQVGVFEKVNAGAQLSVEDEAILKASAAPVAAAKPGA